MALVDDEAVVEALAPQRPDHPFGARTGVRTVVRPMPSGRSGGWRSGRVQPHFALLSPRPPQQLQTTKWGEHPRAGLSGGLTRVFPEIRRNRADHLSFPSIVLALP